MMLAFLTFIRSPLGRWIGALAAVGLALWAVHAHGVGEGRKKERAVSERVLAKVRADLKTCRDNVAALDGALTRQNEAVAAWKASGDAMAARAKEAAGEALKAQREADRLAVKLAGFKSAATCEAREANVAELVAGVR